MQEGVIGGAMKYFFQFFSIYKRMESPLKLYFQNEG